MDPKPNEEKITIEGFKGGEYERASEAYLAIEKQARENKTDAVLVSVSSLAALRRAYPNYFADTRVFVALMNQAISGRLRKIFTGQLALPLAAK